MVGRLNLTTPMRKHKIASSAHYTPSLSLGAQSVMLCGRAYLWFQMLTGGQSPAPMENTSMGYFRPTQRFISLVSFLRAFSWRSKWRPFWPSKVGRGARCPGCEPGDGEDQLVDDSEGAGRFAAHPAHPVVGRAAGVSDGAVRDTACRPRTCARRARELADRVALSPLGGAVYFELVEARAPQWSVIRPRNPAIVS